MALAHDAQTRFPTTDGPSGTNSVDTTTGDRTFNHAGGASAKGAVVVINVTGTVNPVAGVSYGGVGMTLITSAVDTTEAGSVWIYALTGVVIPTGTQTVTLQNCIATGKWVTCSTVTAATDGTKVNAFGTKNTTVAANPTVNVITTATTLLYGGLHGGAASPGSYVVTANYTSQFNNDYGALSARSSRLTSPIASGTIVYDFTYVTSDDYCICAVALEEFTIPPFTVRPTKTPLQAVNKSSVF
jgi:hypothetical protein